MNVIETEIKAAIDKELISACERFPMFSSLHEAYGVIKEEVEEASEELEELKKYFDMAWGQIKLNNNELALNHLTRMQGAALRLAVEACQVSAMCIKARQSERKENNE